MVMERGQHGLSNVGDTDLAGRLAEIHAEFRKRHPGVADIPLTGPLPGVRGDVLGLNSCLEGKVSEIVLAIEGRSILELISEMRQKKININHISLRMLGSPDFTTSKEPRKIKLYRVCIGDLNIGEDYPTFDAILKKGRELGLAECPPEIAVYYRLHSMKTSLRESGLLWP